MVRTISAQYRDPLDEIWIVCAARIGLEVVRDEDVFASTDGRGTLRLSVTEDLDPDDSLAQLIFHELCHSLVEGPDSFGLPDWNLDNTGPRDVPREHACQRLQAFLADRHGLRHVLASTTDFRAFYDELAHPLLPRHDETVVAAVLGAQRARTPPWYPHLDQALAATETIVRAAAAAIGAARTGSSPSIYSTVQPPPPAHPTGLPGSLHDAERTCSSCAWSHTGGRGKKVLRCRQADNVRVEAAWPACERHEASLDCQECGACCRAAYDSVTIGKRDPVVKRHPELVVRRDDYFEIRRQGDRCSALLGGSWSDGGDFAPYACQIYDDRPRPCREFENAGEHCLTARRRVGQSL